MAEGYSYEELTTPPILKFRRRMERQLNKVARALIDALQANEVKDFAHQGSVISRRTYVDHPTRIRAATEITRLASADPARKVESKHDHTGTIFHDLSERMEKAIEATEDAIRNDGKPDRKPKAKK